MITAMDARQAYDNSIHNFIQQIEMEEKIMRSAEAGYRQISLPIKGHPEEWQNKLADFIETLGFETNLTENYIYIMW